MVLIVFFQQSLQLAVVEVQAQLETMLAMAVQAAAVVVKVVLQQAVLVTRVPIRQ
jgi:hypothetical protein